VEKFEWHYCSYQKFSLALCLLAFSPGWKKCRSRASCIGNISNKKLVLCFNTFSASIWGWDVLEMPCCLSWSLDVYIYEMIVDSWAGGTASKRSGSQLAGNLSLWGLKEIKMTFSISVVLSNLSFYDVLNFMYSCFIMSDVLYDWMYCMYL
jgi:hypothetical protein